MYKVSGKNNTNEGIEEKTLSEIEYLENEFINLFNEVKKITQFLKQKSRKIKRKVKIKKLQNQKMAMAVKTIQEMKAKTQAIQMVQAIVQEKHQLMVNKKNQITSNTN